MAHVDLVFAVHGSGIPREHGYALYGATSRIVPAIHERKDVGIFPIHGTPAGDGALLLTARSMFAQRLWEASHEVHVRHDC